PSGRRDRRPRDADRGGVVDAEAAVVVNRVGDDPVAGRSDVDAVGAIPRDLVLGADRVDARAGDEDADAVAHPGRTGAVRADAVPGHLRVGGRVQVDAGTREPDDDVRLVPALVRMAWR